MTAIAISQKMATLYELQTIYSYEDLMDMVEVLEINRTNEDVASKEAKDNGR